MTKWSKAGGYLEKKEVRQRALMDELMNPDVHLTSLLQIQEHMRDNDLPVARALATLQRDLMELGAIRTKGRWQIIQGVANETLSHIIADRIRYLTVDMAYVPGMVIIKCIDGAGEMIAAPIRELQTNKILLTIPSHDGVLVIPSPEHADEVWEYFNGLRVGEIHEQP